MTNDRDRNENTAARQPSRRREAQGALERFLQEMLASAARGSMEERPMETDRFISRLLAQESFSDARRMVERELREALPPEDAWRLALAVWQMNQSAARARRELDEVLAELEGFPQIVAPVVAAETRDGSTNIVVSVHGELLAVSPGPNGQSLAGEVKVGRAVYLSKDRSMVVRVAQTPYPFSCEGRVVQVSQDGLRALVDFGAHNGEVWVRIAEDLRSHSSDLAGQAVLGDPRVGIITELAPTRQAPAEAVRPAAEPIVFAGHWRLKSLLEEAIVSPLRDPGAYVKSRAMNLGRGFFPLVVLLSGPTGSGKTYAARWAASCAGALLIERQPADYRTPLFGQSESLLVGDIERTARLVEDGQGPSAVLLINEIEAILLNRSFATNSSVQSTLLAIVDSFLAAIDILAHRHAATPVAVVLTTNMPDLLDPAALGGHRLTAAITVGYLESVEELAEVCRVYLEDRQLPPEEADALGTRLADLLWSEDLCLLEATVEGQRRPILARDVASPALVVSIVRAAASKAGASGGRTITWEFLVEAATEALAQHTKVVAQGAGGPNSSITLPQFPPGSVSHVRTVFDPAVLTAAAV